MKKPRPLSATAMLPSPATGMKLMELAFAVPQVVAHRVTRMALAGPTLSERDRREFSRMGNEKTEAFRESWMAMLMHAALAQQRLMLSLWRMPAAPWSFATPNALLDEASKAGHAVLQKGLGPVHRRAVANARRLGKTPLR